MVLFSFIGENAPKSVVLIGHSIGGLIARALFIDPEFDSKSVHTIITLATPHSAPVINVDQGLDQFYNQIHTFWNQSKTLDHVSLVAIGGGVNDIQVSKKLHCFLKVFAYYVFSCLQSGNAISNKIISCRH